ncbi:hypothetical protein [Mycoplasma procyoni]|uniref:hypothetical protein n=1 Tax=Mycoplasma procyoni TaxID=568784 RepID=UPI00197C4AB7|nr:hypothetical protein [Mycoplasma procyoni]MBN3534443.1 hypothetical protein [Mycoplasma procyoni]
MKIHKKLLTTATIILSPTILTSCLPFVYIKDKKEPPKDIIPLPTPPYDRSPIEPTPSQTIYEKRDEDFYRDNRDYDIKLKKEDFRTSFLVWQGHTNYIEILTLNELKEIIKFSEETPKTAVSLFGYDKSMIDFDYKEYRKITEAFKNEDFSDPQIKQEYDKLIDAWEKNFKSKFEKEKEELLKKYNEEYFKTKKLLLIKRGISRGAFQESPREEFIAGNNADYSELFIRYVENKISFNRLFDFKIKKDLPKDKENKIGRFEKGTKNKFTTHEENSDLAIFKDEIKNSYLIELDKTFSIDSEVEFNTLYNLSESKEEVTNPDYFESNLLEITSNAVDFSTKKRLDGRRTLIIYGPE